MACRVRGPYEITLEEALVGLLEFAKYRGVKADRKSIAKMLEREIKAKVLVPVELAIDLHRKIDFEETIVDEHDVSNQEWLVSVGLLEPSLIHRNRYPSFESTTFDSHIVEWFESEFESLRTIMRLAFEAQNATGDTYLPGCWWPDMNKLFSIKGAANADEELSKLKSAVDKIPKPKIEETPEERRARLAALLKNKKASGTKAFLREVAEAEGISKTRVTQLTSKAKAKT